MENTSAELPPYAAERGRGNAEPGGQVLQRQPLQQLRRVAQKMLVASRGSSTQHRDETLLRKQKLLFRKPTASVGDMDILPEKTVQIVTVQAVQPRVLHKLNVLVTGAVLDIAA